MRLLLDHRHDLHERLDLVLGDTAGDRLLEIREVAMHAPGDPQAFRGRRDDKRAAILGADRARDEAALGEPIENAGQRRAFVGQAAVELGDRRRRRGREQREDVRFALRQAGVTQAGQIQADPVRRSMNGWNQAQ